MTALANDLTSLGMAPALASYVGWTVKSITGVGTTQGGTSPVVYAGNVALLTSAAGATACTIDSAFPVGQTAMVFNISTVPGLLFPPSSGIINAGSANASINIPALSGVSIMRTSATGFWAVVNSAPLFNATNAITAFAGGGQARATQLTGTMANVTVVATAADSVKLPLAQAGMLYFLSNSDSTDSMQVFGAGTDTINDVATGTGVAQAAGKSAVYFAVTSAPAGKWFRVLSA